MLQTSYFAKVKGMPKGSNVVSIARKTPEGFPGTSCEALMPSSKLLWAFKQGEINEAQYRLEYRAQLDKLDAALIVAQYGKDAIFICYEGIGKFCHRHVLSEWFRDNGFEIKEYGT